MRMLICGLLIPLAVGFAEEKNQNPAKKIEITYSLSGPEMYRTFCASCHGTEGKGNGPAAAALKKTPADLTLLSQKNGGHFPAERVRNYIEGKDAKALQRRQQLRLGHRRSVEGHQEVDWDRFGGERA